MVQFFSFGFIVTVQSSKKNYSYFSENSKNWLNFTKSSTKFSEFSKIFQKNKDNLKGYMKIENSRKGQRGCKLVQTLSLSAVLFSSFVNGNCFSLLNHVSGFKYHCAFFGSRFLWRVLWMSSNPGLKYTQILYFLELPKIF